MEYLGVLLAFGYLFTGLFVATKPRENGAIVYQNPFGPILMGMILAISVLIVCIWPFILFGAAMPALPVMLFLVALAIVDIVLYYWKPAVELINWLHGIKGRQFVITFW